jgi:LysR family transcriptional regulator, hydrogen peroxide-inducible genes activator
MEMRQVRYFLAVAEELNFTRASEKCNVPQPSLSRAIKLLEEELGGPLFRRERESTRLIDLGSLVRPHLQSVYDHSKLARRLSQDFVKKWPLKLGVMSTISPDEIVDLIANIRTRHPHVELRLCDANAKDLRARLLAGDLEVAIYALPGEEPDERIHAIPLFREQMVIAVSPRASPRQDRGVPRSRDAWRILYPSRELRVRRLCRQYSPAERSDLQTPLLEQARRLDLGHGRRRVGIRLHACKAGQATPA